MNKKGQGAIIAMSIGAILAVVILGVIFSTLTAQTSSGVAVADDTFTGINNTCVRLTADCYVPGTLTVSNATTEQDVGGNFSECGDSRTVVFGAIAGIGATASDCTECTSTDGVNASYTGRSCAYITSGTTRTLVNLLPVLLGLAILIFIVGFMVLKGK